MSMTIICLIIIVNIIFQDISNITLPMIISFSL